MPRPYTCMASDIDTLFYKCNLIKYLTYNALLLGSIICGLYHFLTWQDIYFDTAIFLLTSSS